MGYGSLLISLRASAAFMVGTATRIISQPAFSRLKIWFIVDFTSSVFVLHMDWMRTGFPTDHPVANMNNFRILSAHVSFLFILNCSMHFTHTLLVLQTGNIPRFQPVHRFENDVLVQFQLSPKTEHFTIASSHH